MGWSIGIFVFPGVEELDFVGPWEVLRSWQQVWPDDGAVVRLFAAEPGVVECAKGLRVAPEVITADLGPIDVLVYPGGPGTRAVLGDEAHRRWVRALAAGGTLMASVCTGSLVLADAGVLDGRPATTHWAALDHLASLGQGIEVRAGERYVDSGGVVTAAGVSAGIDMALHLVSRLHSPQRAAEVAHYIEYETRPATGP